MTKHLYKLGMVLAMSAGFALAQSTTAPSTTPKTFPDQSQTPSAQQAPATAQPQSTDQMPSSSQTPSSTQTTPSAPSSTSPDQSPSTPSSSAPATSSPQTDQSTSPSSASPSSASPSSPSSSQSTTSPSSSSEPQSTAPSSSSSSASGMPQSDQGASGDTSKIQSALQQNPNLSGISVNSTDKGIELTGSANSSKDRKEAVRIAKENANGKKVIDHIQVAGGATGNAGATSTNPK